nr:hypothetical protein [Bradyrhizobium sediminis]
MRQIRIGDITVDAVIEREGPWRRPQDFFPAYDDTVFKRHLPDMEPVRLPVQAGLSCRVSASFRGAQRTRNLEIPGSLRVAPE